MPNSWIAISADTVKNEEPHALDGARWGASANFVRDVARGEFVDHSLGTSALGAEDPLGLGG